MMKKNLSTEDEKALRLSLVNLKKTYEQGGVRFDFEIKNTSSREILLPWYWNSIKSNFRLYARQVKDGAKFTNCAPYCQPEVYYGTTLKLKGGKSTTRGNKFKLFVPPGEYEIYATLDITPKIKSEVKKITVTKGKRARDLDLGK